MRSTDDQSTIRWLLVVGLYCFRGLKIDFSQNLSLCDRCTKSVRVHQLLFDRRTFMEPQTWKQWMASLKCGGNELEKKEAQKRMT